MTPTDCRRCKPSVFVSGGISLNIVAGRICEQQADAIARRYPNIRIASMRFHWSLPDPGDSERQFHENPERASKDLWGWVQEDAVAEAFLRALTLENAWNGHESFYLAAPTIAPSDVDARELREKYYPDVSVQEAFTLEGRVGFFDCRKAEKMLGWVHPA